MNPKIPTAMIHEMKIKRFRLLNALYQWSGGDTRRWIDLRELCGLNQIEFADKAYHYLADEGLIAYYGSGYTCHITHAGIKAIEQAWETPQQSTAYFPAVATIAPQNGRV